MADSNNTSVGGASVGRDASAGNDLIGRDMTRYGSGDGASSGNRVEIHTEQREQRYASGYTIAENVDDVRHALLGDPYNPSQPGIVRSLADLTASMSAFHAWRTAADVERANLSRDIKHYHYRTNQRLDTTDSRLTAFTVIIWVTALALCIEVVALIWLFIRVSALGG